jgi:predicted metal-binding membrane protein
MVVMLVVGYVSGWLAVTLAVYAAGRRLTDRESPATHPLMVGVAAGAAWPLLVVGLVELSSIIVLTKVPSQSRSSVGIVASHGHARKSFCVGVAGFEPTPLRAERQRHHQRLWH